MSALLYAIAERPPALEDPDLRIVGQGPVGIVRTVAGEVSSTPQALRDHMQTVASLMGERALLPARYGTVVEEPELERLMQQRRESLLAALERVRGAVEVAVHAHPAAAPTSEAAPPRSGTEYLRRRLETQRSAEASPAALAALDARARATRPGKQPGAWAYLVERARLHEFLAAVAELDRAHPGLELVCTGPWPAFSFVGEWP
jgi:hypothetical protein